MTSRVAAKNRRPRGEVFRVANATLDAPSGPLQGVRDARITVVITDQRGRWAITAFHAGAGHPGLRPAYGCTGTTWSASRSTSCARAAGLESAVKPGFDEDRVALRPIW